MILFFKIHFKMYFVLCLPLIIKKNPYHLQTTFLKWQIKKKDKTLETDVSDIFSSLLSFDS